MWRGGVQDQMYGDFAAYSTTSYKTQDQIIPRTNCRRVVVHHVILREKTKRFYFNYKLYKKKYHSNLNHQY